MVAFFYFCTRKKSMNIKLDRKSFVIISAIIVFLFYGINRINIIINSDFVQAKVIDEEVFYNQDSSQIIKSYAIIVFEYDNHCYLINGAENAKHQLGEELKVIIKKKNPKKASAYTFTGFWLNSLIISLIPLMIVIGIILSFINENNVYLVNFKKNKTGIKIEDNNKKSIDLT